MAALTPTFYKIKTKMTNSAMDSGDVHRVLWNMQEALYALINNLDDLGIAGTEFREKVGTDLRAAHDLLIAPVEGETV